MLEPSTPVQYVKGIGPRLAEVLAAKGIATVDDLLHYLPFRYEDRLNPRSVAELRAGEMATVIAEVRNSDYFARAACQSFNSRSARAAQS
jgi:ATP-dependent DNA helicase RecG